MFTALGLALGVAGFAFLSQMAESILTCLYCGISATCLILSLSSIPNAMEEATIVFQNIYRKELLKNNIGNPFDNQRLLLIKSLSEIKPIYITVWDMFRVDNSLLFSFFGCILTFGILIIQIKREEHYRLNFED
ncbi:uncharacterized protein TNCT_287141 [Trichonephila clavata]|uniref:Uncharacterized protein n=1 Tax=Trichonephila clavata TaxID=2740835 RepID=A0A8X6FJ79_TRICU|nr:uncharacterized protein TNCT_287141 [Trichonephila clavata]